MDGDLPPLRVLLVEDEPMVARSIRRILGDRHEIVTAATVQCAREALVASPLFDVVLCDMLLPDGMGCDVYVSAEEHGSGLASRFVFMTGGVSDDVQALLDGLPDARLLEKPFTAAELMRMLHGAVPGEPAGERDVPSCTTPAG